MHKITDNFNDFLIGLSVDRKSHECHVCHKVFRCKGTVDRHLREYHKLTKVVLNREVSGSAS